MIRKIFFVVFVLLASVSASAQRKKKDTPEKFADKLREAESIFSEAMRLYMIEKFADATSQFEKVVELDPNQGGAYFMLSKIHAKKDLPKATTNILKAIEIDENNIYYLEHAAQLYEQQNEYEKAEKYLLDLSKRNPTEIDYLLEIANLYVMQNKYKDAIDAYNKVEKQLGITEEITTQKKLIYLRMNKVEDAMKEGEKLINSEPKDEELLEKEAQLLISLGKLDEAVKMIEKVKKLNPDASNVRVLMAEIYRKRGEIDKMEAELKNAFDDSNLDPNLKIKILQTYMLTLKPSESMDNVIKLTQEMIKKHPENAKAYIIQGDLLTKKGEKRAARDSYAKSTRLDRSGYEVWMALLQLDNDLGDIDSLATHADTAVEYFPNQAFFWYNSGFAHYAKKRTEKARISLEEARNLSSDNQFLSHVNSLLGDVYNSLKKYDESDEAYEAVLALNPEEEHVLNNYSYFLSLRNKNIDKALDMAKRLADKHPNNPTFMDTYAWVLYMNKDYVKAREVLEKIMQSGAKVSGTIVEHYGDALFQTGDTTKALEQWKKAKQLGESSNQLIKKIEAGKLIE